jgi:5,10-methylenetetrahydromethanopterin reductase
LQLAISFGGYYATVENYIEAAKYCDVHGIHSIWLADSQMIHRDVYECLALCANVSTRIKLATGVTNPITRDVTVTASAISTLNEISHGRAILGIGPGDSSVRRIGRLPASVSKLESSVEHIRMLCAGKSVSLSDEPLSMRWSSAEVPIFISATGDKMLRLSGKIGDGAIINVGAARRSLQNAIEKVRMGLEENNRKTNFVLADLSFVNISEDRKEAIKSARPYVIWYWKNAPKLFEINGRSTKELDRFSQSLTQRYIENDHIHTDNWSLALSKTSFITDEMVEKFTIAGTPDDCVRKLKEKESQGIDLFIARHTGEQEEWKSFLKLYTESVVPSLIN